jgi:putative hydrolase of the HAD superfamily
MIRGVICDYGNVLTRTLDPTPRAAWEQQLGLEPGSLERTVHNNGSWIEAQCGRMTADAHWQAIGTQLGLTPANTTALRADFYRSDLRNDDLVRRIMQLRTTGCRLSILSNFSLELHTLLEQHDLRRHFDYIAISAELGIMKPHATAYEAILTMLNLPAAACVFIDDMPANVAAAQALGIHGIVFRDNASCFAALDRLIASPG